MKRNTRWHGPRHQRGAALLTAMIIVTLVVTLSASMVWQQWRAVQVEVAERSRAQSAWILSGALDWARLILREDFKSNRPTAFGEPWSTPLAEARLSSFLAADKDNNADDGPEAFLSGSISDAQGRYNLSNLVGDDGKVKPLELAALERLCQAIGLPAEQATRIADGFRDAMAPLVVTGADSSTATSAPLQPTTLAQLTWLGIDPATIQALEPYAVVLPLATLVNVNTAPREVLVAAIKGLDLASAERLIQARQRQAFSNAAGVTAQVPGLETDALAMIAFKSDYFDVRGRLRLADRALEEHSLVRRDGQGIVTVVQRERVASRDASGR